MVCATSKASDQPAHSCLNKYMTIKLLTELHLESLNLKEAAQARLSLHLSKRHIVGTHINFFHFLDFHEMVILAFCY